MKRLSFFKVLSAKDFSRRLQLPSAFVQKYGSDLPHNVKIRISNGRTWDVTVERRNDMFCFTGGWRYFARDVGLQVGEFVVFVFDGDFTFHVSVFESNFCTKEFPVLSEVKKERGGSGEERNPLYSKILEARDKTSVFLPKMFWVAAGLEEKDSVVLEYVGNHCYQRVGLNHQSQGTYLSRGWSKFRQINRLVLGKVYSFEFNPNKNVIQVKEVSNRN